MELSNIIIILIACVISAILTSIFFKFLLPLIVFVVIAYFVYEVIVGWMDHRRYDF